MKNWLQSTLVFVAAAWASSSLGATITNVTVANVTPSSFTLVWSSAGFPSIEVFADAAGNSNLVGTVGIEWDPVHTGNAGLTDETARRLKKNSLRSRARTLGLGHVRISGLRPGTTYYFRIAARLTGNTNEFYPAAGLASLSTAAQTSFLPEARQLIIDIPGLDNDGHIVTLSHSNAPFSLAAVVGDGAGTNQVFLNLADLLALGGQSNFTANGSQEFIVDLRGENNSHVQRQFTLVFDGAFSVVESAYDVLGIEFSALSLGSLVMRAGATGSVPITFNSSVPVREITAQLQLPTARLVNLALSNLPPAVATVQVVSNSPSTASFHITMQPGQTLQGSFPFGQLWFRAASNQTSGFLPLGFANPVLTKTDGSSVSNVLVQPGRVVLIAEQPLLEAFADPNGNRRMTVYGKPWSGYALEYSSDLTSPNGWQVYARLPLTNMFVTLSALHGNSGTYFYRAAELRSDPPSVVSLTGTNRTRRLLVFGESGGQYTLESTPSLSGVVTWSNVLTYTLTNPFTYIENLGTNTTTTFYRLRRN